MRKTILYKLNTTFLCTLIAFLFIGCAEYSVSNESKKEIRSYEEMGSQIMTDYLDENIPDATLTSCTCYEVYEGDYRYITDYVDGYFDVDDTSYFIVPISKPETSTPAIMMKKSAIWWERQSPRNWDCPMLISMIVISAKRYLLQKMKLSTVTNLKKPCPFPYRDM